MANTRIDFTVGYSIDQSSLNKVEKSFELLAAKANQMDPSKMTTGMKEAGVMAEKLGGILKSAYNQDLGSTNMAKVTTEMKQQGLTMEKVKTAMVGAGNSGATAYNQFASAVLSTNVKLKESNKLLDNMARSMKQSVSWGVTSAIFNSITSSISKAFSYVEKLDKSLTDIRIVSGQTADQMEKFAVQANKAAESLGAQTTEYTNAALIYYQQGLSGDEVTERTDATIKMANATGDSATEVSSYMTAIWNNFDDGSESLEHYADVITALGASTASSSSEISEGLEKFASVADTIGLSYDYATSALATVVANTRQSADTVGTAFKTIFARFDDLEQGDTLDDGTTLGQYSLALEKIGVNIKDASGGLKDMDDILDELGAKWGSLSKDTQIATAQAVAGTRQYTQLVSLMDNWDDMTDNLETAANAEGTLNEQNDIYMDSVEAHLNRIKTSAQDLYATIIDDDVIKDGSDLISGLLKTVTSFFKSFDGGTKSIVAFGGVLAGVFNKQIASGITNMAKNMSDATSNKNLLEAKKQAVKQGAAKFSETDSSKTGQAQAMAYSAEEKGLEKRIECEKQIEEIEHSLSQGERNKLTELEEEVGKQQELLTFAEKKAAMLIKQNLGEEKKYKYTDEEIKSLEEQTEIYNEQIQKLKEISNLASGTGSKSKIDLSKKSSVKKMSTKDSDEFQQSNDAAKALNSILSQDGDEWNKIKDKIKECAKDVGALNNDEKINYKALRETDGAWGKILDAIKEATTETGKEKDKVESVKKAVSEVVEQQAKFNEAQGNFNSNIQAVKQFQTLSSTISGVTAGMGSLLMSFSAFKTLGDVWSSDASIGEKLSQTFMQLGMTVPMLVTGFQQVSTAIKDIKESEAAYNTIIGIEEVVLEKLKDKNINSEDIQKELNKLVAENLATQDEINAVIRERNDLLEKEKNGEVKEGSADNYIKDFLNGKKDKTGSISSGKDKLLDNVQNAKDKVSDFGSKLKESWDVLFNKKGNAKAVDEVAESIADVGEAAGGAASGEAALAEGTVGVTEAAGGATAATGALAGAAIAVGVAAAVAAVGFIAYTIHLKKLKQAATQANQELENSKDNFEKQKEQASNLQEINEKYQDLSKQYKDNEIDLSNLQSQTSELLSQYGLYKESVDALSASYDELSQSIKDATAAQAEELKQSAETTVDNYAKSGAANLFANAKMRNRDSTTINGEKKQTYDVNNQLSAFNPAYGFQNLAYETGFDPFNIASGSDYETNDKLNNLSHSEGFGDISKNGQINVEELIKLASSSSEAYNEVQTIISQNEGSWGKGLQKIISENADNIQGALQVNEETKEQLKESLESDAQLSADSITDYDSYQKQISSMVESAIDDDIFEDTENGRAQAAEWANSVMSQIDDTMSNYALTFDLGEKLKNIDTNFDSDSLAGYSDTELEFLKENYGLIESIVSNEGKSVNEAIAETISSHTDYLNTLDEINKQTAASNALGTLDDNGKYQESDLFSDGKMDADEISENTDAVSATGYSEEEFGSMQGTEQKIALIGAEIQNRDQLNASIDANIESLEAEKKAYQEENEELLSEADGLKDDLENSVSTLNTSDLLKGYTGADKDAVETILKDSDKIAAAYEKRAEGASLSDEEADALDLLTNSTSKNAKAVADAGKKYGDNQSKVKNYTEQLSSYDDQINALKKDEVSYSKVMAQVKNAWEETSDSIDDIQSSYKSLTSAMEDYNENGYLSMDNLQSLLDMDDEYLASLQISNGQMSLNTDVMKQMTLAKLDEAEAEAYMQAMTELSNLDQYDAENAGLASARGSQIASEAVRAAAEMANAATGVWDTYWESVSKGYSGSDAAKQQVGDALKTKLQLIENVRSNIENGNFDSVMGGSSSDSSKDKEEKELDKETDAYHQLKRAIEETSDALDKLDTLKDVSSGNDLINTLEKENKLLEKQAKNYKNLYKEASKQVSAKQKTGKEKYGATFDSEGEISNYQKLYKKYQNEYNKAVKTYNASDQSDSDKDTFEKAEKKWSDFKDWVDSYEEDLEEMSDAEQTYYEEKKQIVENNLEAFNTKIELEIDDSKLNQSIRKASNNLNKKLVDFMSTSAETSMKATSQNVEDITDLLSQADTYTSSVNTVAGEINGLLKGNNSTLINTASEGVEQMEEYESNLEDVQSQLEDYLSQAIETLDSVIEESNEAFSGIISEIDTAIDRMENLKDISSWTQTEKQQDEFNESYYSSQVEAQSNKMKVYTAQIESIKDTMEQLAKENLTDSDKYKNAEDALLEATNNLEESKYSYANALHEQTVYENNKLVDEFMAAATGMESATKSFSTQLDELKESWDRTKTEQERFYDDTEKVYSIDKLSRSYQTAANDAKTTKAKKELAKLQQQEIDYLNTKEKLSKNDYELAEKRLAVAQAQANLEDAQNNKNSMKLTRDTEGNWSYSYVADEDDALEKEQALSDAVNELYETSKSINNEIYEESLSTLETFYEKLQEIANDTSLSESDRQTKMEELYKQYAEDMQYYADQGAEAQWNASAAATEQIMIDQSSVLDATAELTAEQEELYNQTKDAAIGTWGELVTEFGNTNSSLLTSAKGFFSSYDEATVAMKKGAVGKFSTDSDSIANTYSSVTTSMIANCKDFKDTVNTYYGDVTTKVKELGTATTDAAKKTDEIKEKTKSNVAAAITSIKSLKAAWDTVTDAINKALAKIKKYKNEAASNTWTLPTTDDTESTDDTSSSGSTADKSGSKDSSTTTTDSTTSANGKGYWITSTTHFHSTTNPSNYDEMSITPNLGKTGKKLVSGTLVQSGGSVVKVSRNSIDGGKGYVYIEKGSTYLDGNFETLKTGGYTGDWDDGSGKLAVLHSKELVLNADDTANMLSMVDTVRKLTSSIDTSDIAGTITSNILNDVLGSIYDKSLEALNSQTQQMTSSIDNSSSTTTNDNSQTIHIDSLEISADGGVEEIKEAILNLPNLATQYVMQNKK